MSKYTGRIRQLSAMLNRLLKSKKYTIDEIYTASLKRSRAFTHDVPGVYVIYDKSDRVVYTGRTTHNTLTDRVGRQHVYGGSGSDLRNILGRPDKGAVLRYGCRYIRLNDARVRQMFEHFAISILKPKYNK